MMAGKQWVVDVMGSGGLGRAPWSGDAGGPVSGTLGEIGRTLACVGGA